MLIVFHSLHWIPPEYHSNSNNARETIKADVWAFATTLWEIFSYGASPPDWGAHVIKKVCVVYCLFFI